MKSSQPASLFFHCVSFCSYQFSSKMLGGYMCAFCVISMILVSNVFQSLKWMVQCHKDVCQISILRLEYVYLLFNKFIIDRITSELIEIGQILTSFSVTESRLCDDISRASFLKNLQSHLR